MADVKSLKLPKSVIVTIVLFLLGGVGGVFTYSLNRIDKNTDIISDVRVNYVDKEYFEKRMDKIDKKLDRLLEGKP